MNKLNHYWIQYAHSEGANTIIHSTELKYNNANEWAEHQENPTYKDETPLENVAVWEFKEITGIPAAILNVING
ncbi:hypothetical protein NIES4071_36230 [Calothrix sp. NIES-4071]|nr:hypothetical protein NIES4071_36230 [Calothrix sp. NIES-4071]BAZ57942.1 hypothetical protein NIES4105_36160 [Calothrix sp. NIES-4105]